MPCPLLRCMSWMLVIASLAPVVTAADASPAAAPTAQRLLTFGADFDLTKLTGNSADLAHGGSAEAPALRVTARARGSWPGVTIPAPAGKWDLSTCEFLALDIRNVDKNDVDVYVRVDNPGADGASHCMTERIGTQPDQRVTITIPLKRVANGAIKLVGMHGYPQDLSATGIDPANVVALTVFIDNNPSVAHTFEISNIRAFGSYRKAPWASMTEQQFFPFIDQFGQFAHKDWPGKTHSVDELRARRDAEAAQLAADKGPTGWDSWGGWAAGPQLEGTGHFRTAKHDNRWWLVDPDGRLFFSTGLTCVGPGFANTAIDDREKYFAWLPTTEDDPLHRFLAQGGKSWGGGYYRNRAPKVMDFSGANLFRKYGADWASVYPDVVHKRLRAWGINSIGNWSDGGYARMKRTPYTCTFFYDSPRMQEGRVGFPDMFAPTFAPALDRGIAQFLAGTMDDPWCIGYFLDNEMPWGGEDTLARYALGSPATQAAKQKLAAWLTERHKDIAGLNAAWGTTWASWDAFAADTKANPTGPEVQRDLVDFTGVAADAYFSTVRAALRKAAPKKLYLGCRCVGGSANVVAAAVKGCDVISYNRYCASVRDISLPEGFDAPVMIGEFHFGGLDRGAFWSGLFSAESQADRGAKYAAYVQSALDNPQIVGVHWFQYGDEATTGRIDGENAQCGFVDLCDTPYAETIQAARASAETMYRRRSGIR